MKTGDRRIEQLEKLGSRMGDGARQTGRAATSAISVSRCPLSVSESTPN